MHKSAIQNTLHTMKTNLIQALLLGALTFLIFRCGYLRSAHALSRTTIVIIALVMAVPAVLFASNYVLFIPYARWFYELHSQPGAEMSAGFITAILGVMFASAKLRPGKLNVPILVVCTIITSVLLLTPFAKQLFFPVDYGSLKHNWKDGVCIQSSGYTCVPACAATYMRLKGWQASEPELARSAGTTRNGTEMWYLIRALRRKGYEAKYSHVQSVKDAPVPSIIGVNVGNIGHVVVLLGKNKDGVTIGEPLRGRCKYSWSTFVHCYKPDGNYFIIVKRAKWRHSLNCPRRC